MSFVVSLIDFKLASTNMKTFMVAWLKYAKFNRENA